MIEYEPFKWYEMIIDLRLTEWIRGISEWSSMKKNRLNNQTEYEFSTHYLVPKSRKQWTNEFGERLVESIINSMNNCKVLERQPVVYGHNKHRLDLLTRNAYIEVKTRNYTTNGTAGEKIWGAVAKYSDVYTITGKPVFIVLVGYQEKEAVEKMDIFRNELKPMHDFIWDTYHVKFILCSELLDGKYNDYL
jgi:hypothetical protein